MVVIPLVELGRIGRIKGGGKWKYILSKICKSQGVNV